MKISTETAPKNRDWRQEYFDNLESLQRERKQFLALESVLKRLASRLCAASLGQSPLLDEHIRLLQAAMRRESSSDELDKIASALTDAVAKLDAPAPAPRAAPTPEAVRSAPEPAAKPAAEPVVKPVLQRMLKQATQLVQPVAQQVQPVVQQAQPMTQQPRPDASQTVKSTVQQALMPPVGTANVLDDRLRAILSALLTELRRDPDLVIRVDAVNLQLAADMVADQLTEAIASISELVMQRIRRIERGKQEIEILLSHMVGRLDEIGRFIADHNDNESQSLVSRESLSAQLMGEMKAMGESVDAALDVHQIRTQVRGRLDSIGQYLREFRDREASRTDEIRARNEQMRTRVAQLEAEAQGLKRQLDDEQRLSTIDTLTNIANRLAYEKRIEEELQRWKRFRQPTCVAVWDIDRFKDINDKYGHRAGDRVLRAVAESLAGRVRSTDFLARFGGEEFVMIFCGTKIEDAVRVIDEMRIAVASLHFHIHGTPLAPVTISTGVTELMPNDSAGSAFDRADRALYQAKNTGRNKCVSG